MRKLKFLLAFCTLFCICSSFSSQKPTTQEPKKQELFMKAHPSPCHTINVSYYSYVQSAGLVYVRIFLDAPSDAYHQVILQTNYYMQSGTADTFYPDIEVNQGETTAVESYGGNFGAGHGFSSYVLMIL